MYNVYVFVAYLISRDSPNLDNVSDHNQFDRSRIKLAKNMLIEAKRYIIISIVNGFAHKCNRVWTKLVCSSCVPLILCWRAHILVFVEERFNPVYSMIVFSARPYETIQDQWNPHNLQDQWGSHKLQRMWKRRFANPCGRWISLGFHVLESWETCTKTTKIYI